MSCDNILQSNWSVLYSVVDKAHNYILTRPSPVFEVQGLVHQTRVDICSFQAPHIAIISY